MIVIESFDPGWAAQGSALAAELLDAFGAGATRVEHIGSTSIPGMDAKPVFDLQVSVRDLDSAEQILGPVLDARGYTLSIHRHDHVPAGSDSPPELWAKRLWTRRGGPDVNLHVRMVGSPNERLALLFRDWFRAHPEAVPAYSRFKRLLAGALADLDSYADVKDPVVDLVVVTAERWALDTNWRP